MRAAAARLLLAAVLLCSAAAAPAQDDDDALLRARARGALEVAVYDHFPPYSYRDAQGRPAGVDVDLGRALARKLGLEARLRLFTPGEDVGDDLRNQVWKGHYLGGGVADVMLHAPADPQFAAREQQALLFGAYFHESVAVLHRSERLRNFTTPLQLSGQRVGVELDSISDYYLSGAFNGRLRSAAVRMPSLGEALHAFDAGQLDAVMGPRGELQGLAAAAGSHGLQYRQQELAGLFRTAWDIGMAVRAEGGQGLRAALDAALAELRADGTLAGIFAAHGIDYMPAGVPALE